MSIKKQFLKTKEICKVTFKLSGEEADGAEKVNIVGDFNNWDKEANLMRQLKDGSFTIVLDLDKGNEYQFRYLVGDDRWINEPESDRFQISPYGDSENSVVSTIE